MAENAGHAVSIGLSSSLGGAYTEIGSLNSVSLTRDRTVLDLTNFKDTSAHKLKMMGLKDTKIELSGNRDLADAQQSALSSRYDDGASTFIQIGWDGSTFKKGEFKVANFSEKASVDGLVEFSVSLEGTPNSAAGAVWG